MSTTWLKHIHHMPNTSRKRIYNTTKPYTINARNISNTCNHFQHVSNSMPRTLWKINKDQWESMDFLEYSCTSMNTNTLPWKQCTNNTNHSLKTLEGNENSNIKLTFVKTWTHTHGMETHGKHWTLIKPIKVKTHWNRNQWTTSYPWNSMETQQQSMKVF